MTMFLGCWEGFRSGEKKEKGESKRPEETGYIVPEEALYRRKFSSSLERGGEGWM